MRAIILILVILLYPMVLVAASQAKNPEKTEADINSESILRTSDRKQFSVEMFLKGKKLRVGKNDAEIYVRDDKNNLISGAEIKVLPYIARHGESTLIKPGVTEKGNGLYHVRNIYIDMEGDWVLKVTVRKDDKKDNVVFEFPGVKRRK